MTWRWKEWLLLTAKPLFDGNLNGLGVGFSLGWNSAFFMSTTCGLNSDTRLWMKLNEAIAEYICLSDYIERGASYWIYILVLWKRSRHYQQNTTPSDERTRKPAAAASPERNSHIMHQNYHLQTDFLVRTHLDLLAFRTRLRKGTYSANRRPETRECDLFGLAFLPSFKSPSVNKLGLWAWTSGFSIHRLETLLL